MCQQIKMRFVDCSHIACDLYIIHCDDVKRGLSCTYQTTGIPDWRWSDTQEMGKCHFCTMEDKDQKKKRRRVRKAWRTELW